jgi:hypothetical protein
MGQDKEKMGFVKQKKRKCSPASGRLSATLFSAYKRCNLASARCLSWADNPCQEAKDRNAASGQPDSHCCAENPFNPRKVIALVAGVSHEEILAAQANCSLRKFSVLASARAPYTSREKITTASKILVWSHFKAAYGYTKQMSRPKCSPSSESLHCIADE